LFEAEDGPRAKPTAPCRACAKAPCPMPWLATLPRSDGSADGRCRITGRFSDRVDQLLSPKDIPCSPRARPQLLTAIRGSPVHFLTSSQNFKFSRSGSRPPAIRPCASPTRRLHQSPSRAKFQAVTGRAGLTGGSDVEPLICPIPKSLVRIPETPIPWKAKGWQSRFPPLRPSTWCVSSGRLISFRIQAIGVLPDISVQIASPTPLAARHLPAAGPPRMCCLFCCRNHLKRDAGRTAPVMIEWFRELFSMNVSRL